MSSFARSLVRRRDGPWHYVKKAGWVQDEPSRPLAVMMGHGAKAAAREMTRQAVAADPGFLAKLRAALGVS